MSTWPKPFLRRRISPSDQILKESKPTLEERVEARTRELATLLMVSQNVISTLDLETLLRLSIDQLGAVIPFTGVSLMVLDKDRLRVAAYRGPIHQETALAMDLSLESSPCNRKVIRERRPVIISDVRGPTQDALDFRIGAGNRLQSTFAYIRSWMGVPLLAKDRVIGMLALDSDHLKAYDRSHASLALAFANQVAAAIENARLYEEVQHHAEEVQALFSVQQAIARRQDQDSILQLIAREACKLIPADNAAVYLPDGDDLVAAVVSGKEVFAKVGSRIPVDSSYAGQSYLTRKVVLALNVKPLAAPQGSRPLLSSLLIAPMVSNTVSLGAIAASTASPQGFTEDDEKILSMLASAAVVGLENARLYRQERQTAVEAERNRIARDLHDAVTQTLFSASLIADILPVLWKRNEEEGKRRLEELRLLTRGALAEMRTLLLELRPSSIIDSDIGDLVRQLADAAISRARLPVKVEIQGRACLPPDVQVAVYRIVQEALNNIAKHARAKQVDIYLSSTPNQIYTIIEDDGCGFNPQDVSAGHLGLQILRERAESVHADLQVKSTIGKGTRVELRWNN